MPKRTPNYSAWKYVDNCEEFIGSSLRGETYTKGYAPHLSESSTWMSGFETEQYAAVRHRVTYIVWSFWTPIAYYVEGQSDRPGQWYRVGQTFSSFTSRHVNGALRNVPHHNTTLSGSRGNWTVTCIDCGTERHFTRERDTHGPLRLH